MIVTCPWQRRSPQTTCAACTTTVCICGHTCQRFMQLLTDDLMAMGLRRALMRRGVRGIINGLDTSAWDPATDPLLTPRMRFLPATARQGKAAAKAWLQGHCGLPNAPHTPVVAFLGRLTHQKGVDLLLKAVIRAVGPDVLAREAAERHTHRPSHSAQVRAHV
jgi:glycosyltransferase involved in cell wall biosynthesis